jgi:hypothetical protein
MELSRIARSLALTALAVLPALASCATGEPEGLALAQPAQVTVKMDFLHRPFPEIAMPTDLATRYDPSSPTKLRLNASKVAPTSMDRIARGKMDTLDGWGVFGAITVPFSDDIDVRSILDAHRDPYYDQSNDVIYLINITPSSPEYGEAAYLDLGEGNFPKVVKEIDGYWDHDPRGHTLTILWDEVDEDTNGDGILQPEEDTDADAVLDVPNYLPGAHPDPDDLSARADAIMTFYERETHTVIAHPIVPLEERTTYAVVVTRRLRDKNGNPVGSPYPFINHAAQTEKLRPLIDVLPRHGLRLEDVAFTWAYTTGSITAPLMAVRDGLYGQGPQRHIATQFPPDIQALAKLKDFGDDPYIVRGGEFIDVALDELGQVDGGLVEGGDETLRHLQESHQFIDFHVVGSFESPQMFPRQGPDGKKLHFDDQVWPDDIDRVPAPARSEKIQFWLTVPRKEVSRRGEGKPAPLVLLGNGYQSSKFELFAVAGYFARAGLASLIIESVSHGFSMSKLERAVALGLFEKRGYRGFAEAVLTDRSFDQNGDGTPDSGADFWTAYVFHTRDVLRQSVVDYFQLARIIKAMDGKRNWVFGRPGLAGDFDGDGELDIGGDAPLMFWGGSLGGIIGTILGGTEPHMDAVATVSGGGGLSEGAPRSLQGGIREAFVLRLMSPVYLGTPLENAPGKVAVKALVPDLALAATVPVGELDQVHPGDTVVVHNLENGKVGCCLVNPDGSFRLGVESGIGDRHVLTLYDGIVLTARKECELIEGASARRKATFDRFGNSVEFQYLEYDEDSPLRSLAEGYGLKRATPALRRLLGLGQHALDASDPVVWAQYLGPKTLRYPRTGEVVQTRAMLVSTVGDMGVPVAMGANVGRAAGLIDFLHPDPRYGKSVNQVLIDTHVIEGVNTIKRYTDSAGRGTLYDVDNFSEGQDEHHDTPRLDPPLRLVQPRNGGVSASFFFFVEPEGVHGGVFPGQKTDIFIADCMEACDQAGDDDPCGCAERAWFDPGVLEANVFAEFLWSEGKRITFDSCKFRNDCDYFAPLSAVKP